MNPFDSENVKKRASAPDEEDALEELQEGLYSRRKQFGTMTQSTEHLKPHDIPVQKNWGGSGLPPARNIFADEAARAGFLKKLFVGAVTFFIISLGIALIVFFVGGNTISSNNVDIAITGPVSVSGGEVLPLEITVTNQNNADLETADLIIEYPDGTRQADNTSVALQRYREALGTIAKGASVTKKEQAVLYGQEGDVKSITVSVEYRVKGSNAIFPKSKVYTVTISSSPVSINVTSVSDLNSGQDAIFTVDVVSNASSVIQNVALSADYPFGFTWKSGDPAPSWSNNYWQLGDLKPGVKRTVRIIGSLVGQDTEQKTFHFSVGTQSPSNENVIGTSFLSSAQTVTIKKPFIGAALALDGDTSDVYTAPAGKNIRADLSLANNLGAKITNVKVSVQITGNAFDQSTVTSNDGFYQSSNSTVLWDQAARPALAVLNPDDSLTLSFAFATLPKDLLRAIKNTVVNLAVNISGVRINDAGSSEAVTATIAKTVHVPSALDISTRALYFSGSLINTGPLPPKVNTPTSYTIVWSLTNGSNDLSNVKVTATLPPYVTWLAVSRPSTEHISYNDVGGQITWDVGDLPAGTGFSGSPREVSFQVSLLPSTSQVRTSPSLVGAATASGDDNFAGLSVQATASEDLTTDLTTDVSFRPEQAVVVK